MKWGYGERGAGVGALLQALRVRQRGRVHPYCQMPCVPGGLLHLLSEEGGSTGGLHEPGSHQGYVPGEGGPVMMCVWREKGRNSNKVILYRGNDVCTIWVDCDSAHQHTLKCAQDTLDSVAGLVLWQP